MSRRERDATGARLLCHYQLGCVCRGGRVPQVSCCVDAAQGHQLAEIVALTDYMFMLPFTYSRCHLHVHVAWE